MVIIVPAIILGIIIGFIELLFVHADQDFRGSKWLMHGLHAMLFSILFIFINMNVDYVIGVLGFSFNYLNYIIYLVVAIIAFIKISGAAAGSGKVVREKIWHTLFIVILITLAPILWHYIAPVCKSLINPMYC